MKRIGLLGEDPNDTQAIQHLLAHYYKGRASFKTILRNKRGHQLDTESTLRALQLELSNNDLDIIIFIRDLDGLEADVQKIKSKQAWFKKLNAVAGNNGIFLLNIYELEALILADIEVFNKEFKTNISVGNVMFQTEPKEFLIRHSRKSNPRKLYTESHCPELFKKLRYKTVEANCKYFKTFTIELESRLKKPVSKKR